MSHRTMVDSRGSWVAVITAAAAMLGLLGPAANVGVVYAQMDEKATVVVRIAEQESGRAVADAGVVLMALEPGANVGRHTSIAAGEAITNQAGIARLRVAPGKYLLRTTRLGFAGREDTVSITGRDLDVRVTLSAKPIELEPIAVVGRSSKLRDTGYYERKDSGLPGWFVTQEDVERYNPRGLTDLFQRIPATKITYDGPGRRVIRFRRWPTPRGTNTDGCVPDVYLDGALMGGMASGDGIYAPRLADYDIVSPSELEGMEVYVGATTPTQYRNPCGVVLIWTRR